MQCRGCAVPRHSPRAVQTRFYERPEPRVVGRVEKQHGEPLPRGQQGVLPGREGALDLTRMESRVAVLVTQGMSVPEITAATGHKESTILSHVKHMFAKHGLSRQAELVRLVLVSGRCSGSSTLKAQEAAGRRGRRPPSRPFPKHHRKFSQISPMLGKKKNPRTSSLYRLATILPGADPERTTLRVCSRGLVIVRVDTGGGND